MGAEERAEDFHEWEAGEWHEPIHDGYKMACCDCGLVHSVDFAVAEDEPQVQMRVFRDEEATRLEREARNITLADDSTEARLRAAVSRVFTRDPKTAETLIASQPRKAEQILREALAPAPSPATELPR